jgi:hypothetical protein
MRPLTGIHEAHLSFPYRDLRSPYRNPAATGPAIHPAIGVVKRGVPRRGLVIAEGIEHSAELRVLDELGVPLV